MSEKDNDLVSEEEIRFLDSELQRIVQKAITDLYNEPIEYLIRADPSMETIALRCRALVAIINKDTGYAELARVCGEAAEAITDRDDKRIVDCASHLQDILSNI